MKLLMTEIYMIFFLAYSPSTLESGITSLKSLLHDGDTSKS